MNLFLLLCVARVVWADNIFYHKKALEFKPSDVLRKDSFFGYSTTYDRFNKALIISAPRENDIGEVYQCNLSDQSCSKLGHKRDRLGPSGYDHDYWFGATVSAGSKFIVACSPRFTENDGGSYGRCYKRIANNNNFTTEMAPIHFQGKIAVELGMNTLGWSLDVADDDSVIVGGPVFCKTKGTAALLPPHSKTSTLVRIGVTQIDAAYNFGYSVAAGYFIDEKTLLYAVGSTYGKDGVGQVYFYRFRNFNWVNPTRLRREVDVDDVGSMFGAVLCAANLQNEAMSDLLVGAPTFALKSGYNLGAVYVYTFWKKGFTPAYKRRIIGQKDGSFFGNAIVSVGDLNNDGKDEVAIGAPFEESDHGAVYLYSGAQLCSDMTEQTLTWLQRILPEKYTAFGHSLAVLQDYDDNGCNELAISAPYDDRVVVYRCIAAVTIDKISTTFPNLQNRTRLHKTDYTFEVCLDVKYPPKPAKIVAEISTNVTMMHTHASLAHPNKDKMFNFVTSLHEKKPRYCQNVDFTIPLDGNYLMQIRYDIQTSQLHSPVLAPDFDGAHVVLSDNSELSHSGAVSAAECKDSECISNLSIAINTNISNHFIIGSYDRGSLSMNVLNTGEVAYDPCIQFTISGAPLYQRPMDCVEMPGPEKMWECTSRKPVQTNDTWSITGIIVDLQGLTNTNSDIRFNVTLYERCATKYKPENKELMIPLRSYPEGVNIRGTTDLGDIVNVTKNDLIHGDKRFEHDYIIINNGPTTFESLEAEIKIQKEEFIKYSASYYLDTTQIAEQNHKECEIVDPKNGKDLTASCSIDKLSKQHYVKVVITMDIIPNTLDYTTLQAQPMTLNSTLTLQFDKDYKIIERVSTMIQLQEGFVPLWIILIACLVGLLIILLLAYALYECGFLRRKNKEELQELKRTVQRQSIRRSMMQQSRAQDHAQILERMEEEDETGHEAHESKNHHK